MGKEKKKQLDDKLLNESDFKQKNDEQTETFNNDLDKINFAELPIESELEE
ncbi:hypothetical protein [Paenibacillus sp. GXUN7292]|uniref:hypothetical protein n=1 Tax=Paenibacillus sp. GXUN7292 TaxID=3422499 RepID=UPI003D7C7940